ncbi:MAG: hypothetical protein EBU49_01215 [Proteobacteria bacterium]|nr:hypothetical protein [Pseudomonadota bacterium]
MDSPSCRDDAHFHDSTDAATLQSVGCLVILRPKAEESFPKAEERILRFAQDDGLGEDPSLRSG